jgi:hypothetical protein
LSQSCNRRLGHERATRLCLGRQPSAVTAGRTGRDLLRLATRWLASLRAWSWCLQV